MTRRDRRALWLALPMIVVIGLGASDCGGGDSGSGTTEPATDPGAGTPPVGAPTVVAIKIEVPANDSIILGSSVDANGAITADGGTVSPEVKVQAADGPEKSAQVSADRWTVSALDLPTSLGIVTARSQGEQDRVLVTRGSNIGGRPGQKFRLDWEPAAETAIREIAEGTLNRTLNATQLASFVTTVKSGVEAALLTRYADWEIELVQSDGSDVHTIRMLGNTGDIYGQSPFDCGNTELKQDSQVWVGTYRDSMLQVDRWAPMDRGDTLQQRIADVTQALARTSAHELGHSLGLVGQGIGDRCVWMRGCNHGHNCRDVDHAHDLADRFRQGKWIMDPGEFTTNHARLAEMSPANRNADRTPAEYNPFNSSYLSIVHPTP